MTEAEADKKLNVCVFCEDEAVQKLLSKVLVARGYNVFFYDYPKDCLTVAGEKDCVCTRKNRCADIVILWRHMRGMRAVDVIKRQLKGGCKLTIKNKIILCSTYDKRDAEDAEALGVVTLYLPFPLEKLNLWLDGCEKRLRKK